MVKWTVYEDISDGTDVRQARRRWSSLILAPKHIYWTQFIVPHWQIRQTGMDACKSLIWASALFIPRMLSTSMWNEAKRFTEKGKNVNDVCGFYMTLDFTWHYSNCVYFICHYLWMYSVVVRAWATLNLTIVFWITSYARKRILRESFGRNAKIIIEIIVVWICMHVDVRSLQ